MVVSIKVILFHCISKIAFGDPVQCKIIYDLSILPLAHYRQYLQYM